MHETFIHKTFSRSSRQLIDQANAIIAEYRAQGFVLTLRQLYYQFVARDLFANTFRNYKRLGNVVSDARLAGEIDWSAMEDRTRELETTNTWDNVTDIIDACADQFKINKWLQQEHYVEVWIEKEALVGVIDEVCKQLEVPYFACRGYVSQSEQYDAGKRFEKIRDRTGREIHVLHLGDTTRAAST